MGAVTLVLVIACANVAHLLHARSAVSQKEFAIRTALGASGPHLIQPLLTENGILGAAGGPLGLAISPLGINLLTATAGHGHVVPRTEEIHIDEKVIGFASLLTAALIGTPSYLQFLAS